jgi:hypothetical protein
VRIEIRTEQKTAPAAVQQRLARAGGLNRFGEPMFRVVWGWSRLSLFGGKWEAWDLDKAGRVVGTMPFSVTYEYRRLPKYEPWFCWHVEKWMPPEHFGTREAWYRKHWTVEDGRGFLELGPYPHRGEYEQCFPVIDPSNPKIPVVLTPTLVEHLVHAIRYSQQLVAKDPVKSLEAIQRREAAKARDWDTYADALLDDAPEAFHGEPFVSFAGAEPNPTHP